MKEYDEYLNSLIELLKLIQEQIEENTKHIRAVEARIDEIVNNSTKNERQNPPLEYVEEDMRILEEKEKQEHSKDGEAESDEPVDRRNEEHNTNQNQKNAVDKHKALQDAFVKFLKAEKRYPPDSIKVLAPGKADLGILDLGTLTKLHTSSPAN